jgi:hypothetical protein
LAAGATTAVLASRWMKKQAERMAPTNVARTARDDVMDFSKRVAESVAEGKRAMAEAERDIRSDLDPPVD